MHIVLFEFKPNVTHAQVEDVCPYPEVRFVSWRAIVKAKPRDSLAPKSSINPAESSECQVCTRMLALAQTCLHPATKQPYVTSYGGGRDNSPEGLQVVVYSHAK